MLELSLPRMRSTLGCSSAVVLTTRKDNNIAHNELQTTLLLVKYELRLILLLPNLASIALRFLKFNRSLRVSKIDNLKTEIYGRASGSILYINVRPCLRRKRRLDKSAHSIHSGMARYHRYDY